MRVIVILLLLLIIGSLGSALFFLYRDRGGTRMVRALTWRVGLSVGLFVVLLAGYHFGFIGNRL